MATHGQRINELQEGRSAVLEKIPGGGSLEARRLGSGSVMLYWRYTQQTRTERVPIGVYDPSAPPKSLKSTTRGFSVQAALEKAREMARTNREAPGGLRAERERQKAAQAAETQAKAARESFTLKALFKDYCEWLKAQGKGAHGDAANMFKNHLEEPYPGVVNKPAAEVSKLEIIAPLRRLTEGGKKTTARKLRAYLRAAYTCALHADSDASIPSKFISYRVNANPVEGTAAIKGQADKRPLSIDELRGYWKALQADEGVKGAALRLHLLSGGQREAQLTRLKDSDVNGQAFKLLDRKGRRSEPRSHLIPITKPIRAEMGKLSSTGYVLSTDGGKTHMHSTTLSSWAQAAAARARIENFQLKRVRSGIETLLAEAGIAKDIRGQLQSHGLGGVQDRHYDAHEYLPQKKHALEVLFRLLQGRAKASSKSGAAKSSAGGRQRVGLRAQKGSVGRQ